MGEHRDRSPPIVLAASGEGLTVGPSVSIVVPTMDPGEHVTELVDALLGQRLQPIEVVVVDSASTDGSPERWRGAGFRVIGIERADFDHGASRNLGARACRGDILVFMTQDAVPANERWLEALVSSITSGESAAAFARQMPKGNSSSLERFGRGFNYPALSRTVTLADVDRMGVRAFFFSNVCSAVSANSFWRVGGFPEGVIFNEDLVLSAKLLRAGHSVRYEAGAMVCHSHEYGIAEQFKRNFDNGVSFARSGDLLRNARTTGEGARFVKGQLAYTWKHGGILDPGRVLMESTLKLAAFQLGKRERLLPVPLKRRMSMNTGFWRRR